MPLPWDNLCTAFKSIYVLFDCSGPEITILIQNLEASQPLNPEGALAIRHIFSLVDMITKPKFSNCPNVFKIGLFR